MFLLYNTINQQARFYISCYIYTVILIFLRIIKPISGVTFLRLWVEVNGYNIVRPV